MGTDLTLLLQDVFFTILLAAASIWDIQKRIIPDTICIGIALTGLITIDPLKLLGILAAVIFLLIGLVFGGVEGGDIKLMAAAGLVLGFEKCMAATVIGLTALLVFHTISAITQNQRGRNIQKAYPLVPFLSFGCLAAYFLF